MSDSWIKLFSKFLDWEWYKNQNTKDLFIHCLLKANWKDGRFEGVEIKRGSFATSLQTLQVELGMSKQEVRTALKNLISTQELTQEQHTKFSIITIKNYELYQQVNTLSNTGATHLQHTSNTLATPIEEYRSNNNINNIYNIANLISQKFKIEIETDDLELIDNWLSHFSENVINHAIKLAVLSRNKKILYVNGILKQWKQSNLSDLEIIKNNTEISKKPTEKKELFDYDWLNDTEK